MKIGDDKHAEFTKSVEEMVKSNAFNARYQHGISYLHDREKVRQQNAARQWMQQHFVAGVDPPPQCFDRGTITAQNMVSSKLGYLTKAQ